jgi:hypothetical protein
MGLRSAWCGLANSFPRGGGTGMLMLMLRLPVPARCPSSAHRSVEIPGVTVRHPGCLAQEPLVLYHTGVETQKAPWCGPPPGRFLQKGKQRRPVGGAAFLATGTCQSSPETACAAVASYLDEQEKPGFLLTRRWSPARPQSDLRGTLLHCDRKTRLLSDFAPAARPHDWRVDRGTRT